MQYMTIKLTVSVAIKKSLEKQTPKEINGLIDVYLGDFYNSLENLGFIYVAEQKIEEN